MLIVLDCETLDMLINWAKPQVSYLWNKDNDAHFTE